MHQFDGILPEMPDFIRHAYAYPRRRSLRHSTPAFSCRDKSIDSAIEIVRFSTPSPAWNGGEFFYARKESK